MSEEGTPGVRLHRLLVRLLLPPAARREHGEEIVRLFIEVRRDARRSAGAWGAHTALLRELTSLVRLAAREWAGKLLYSREDARRFIERGRGEGMRGFTRDLGFATRALARRPTYTSVTVATLALGIGAAASIFSVVNGVLLRTLPYPEPDEVVLVGELDPRGGYDAISYDNFRDWQRLGTMFEEVAIVIGNSVAVSGEGEPERIRGMFVTASYFPLTGTEPALGRAIVPGEDVPGGPRVAVIGHGLWQRRYGGDPEVLGRTVVLNNEPHAIVGVLPAGHREVWDAPEALISLHTAPRTLDRASRQLEAMARLTEGVGLDRAREELAALTGRLAEAHPDANAGRGGWAEPLASIFASRHRSLLLSLAAAVATLLLVACANVASLQVARSGGRVRELAVRSALGGSRRRLARELLAESLLIAGAGGAIGALLARAGVRGLVALNPSYGTYFDVGVDGRVLAVTLLVAVGSGVLMGLAPAWWAGRTDLVSTLREGGRGASAGPAVGRIRSGMVVVQVTLAVALLVSAGLLGSATSRLLGQDMGFERDGLLTLEFRLPENKYPTDESVVRFLEGTLERVRALPGVTGAASADALPFADPPARAPFLLEGRDLAEAERAPRMAMVLVSPSYPRVMEIPVLAGRPLLPTDRRGSPPVALLSRTAAERFFGGDDPVGRRFYVSEDGDVAEIVGVVDDVRHRVGPEHEALVYLSVLQRPDRFASLAVRVAGDPLGLAPAVREAVWSVDADQPVWEVMTLGERIRATLSRERSTTVLFGAFAAMAVLLSTLGLYGVLAQSVTQRRRELGVRLALGAGARRVVALVVGDGLRLTLVGMLLGLGCAALVGRLLAATVLGLEPYEPLPYLAAVALLGAVATLATWLPARRASVLDPVRTLREE